MRHTPQLIRDSFAAFLNITRDLGARYTVLYNGPRCGASAPDHLHFQAGNRSYLPIDAEFDDHEEGHAAAGSSSPDSFRAYSAEKCLRHFITFESADAGMLLRAFGALYEAFQEGGPAGEEPMLNILGFYTNGEWRIHFFPRAKHRPSFYFKEGDGEAADQPRCRRAGRHLHHAARAGFQKVTREHIVEMYEEVCVPAERFAGITAHLRSSLADLARGQSS